MERIVIVNLSNERRYVYGSGEEIEKFMLEFINAFSDDRCVVVSIRDSRHNRIKYVIPASSVLHIFVEEYAGEREVQK